jgi:hypothetical protein
MYIHTNIHYIYNVNTYYEMHLCILHVYTVYSNIYIISHLQNLDLVVDCVRMCQENHNGLIGDRLDTMVRKPHLIFFSGLPDFVHQFLDKNRWEFAEFLSHIGPNLGLSWGCELTQFYETSGISLCRGRLKNIKYETN